MLILPLAWALPQPADGGKIAAQVSRRFALSLWLGQPGRAAPSVIRASLRGLPGRARELRRRRAALRLHSLPRAPPWSFPRRTRERRLCAPRRPAEPLTIAAYCR